MSGFSGPAATGIGLILIATRTTAKKQMSASSSSGVTAALLRGFLFLDACGLCGSAKQHKQKGENRKHPGLQQLVLAGACVCGNLGFHVPNR